VTWSEIYFSELMMTDCFRPRQILNSHLWHETGKLKNNQGV